MPTSCKPRSPVIPDLSPTCKPTRPARGAFLEDKRMTAKERKEYYKLCDKWATKKATRKEVLRCMVLKRKAESLRIKE